MAEGCYAWPIRGSSNADVVTRQPVLRTSCLPRLQASRLSRPPTLDYCKGVKSWALTQLCEDGRVRIVAQSKPRSNHSSTSVRSCHSAPARGWLGELSHFSKEERSLISRTDGDFHPRNFPGCRTVKRRSGELDLSILEDRSEGIIRNVAQGMIYCMQYLFIIYLKKQVTVTDATKHPIRKK